LYAHFRSRNDLIDAVLARWRQGVSHEVPRIVRSREMGPLDTLRRLLELSFVDNPDVVGGPFEMTLRGWARRDARVREIMHYVDNAVPLRWGPPCLIGGRA
jgi:AcrR family transcriptional regulator